MLNVRRLGTLFGLVMMVLLVMGGSVSAQVDNVILMIGDGMGFDHMSVARYCKGQQMHMDKLPYTGYMTTHSSDSYVTDSAAAGTAIATGYKTYNGAISYTPDDRKPTTLLEAAQKQNKKVGLVSTTRLTHATPASFAAHVDDRDKENEIAEQILNKNIDVLLGGGWRHFLPRKAGGRREKGSNLIKKAWKQDYKVVNNRYALHYKAQKADKILGLFSKSHMSYELDRNPEQTPSLAEMTDVALKNLSQDKDGFFLMVEGGRIDHASHGNDAATMVEDLLAFDQAVKEAQKFVEEHPDTLLIVTSDHETGGLGAAAGPYKIKPEVLNNVSRSAGYIAGKLNEERSNVKKVVSKYANLELTEEEVKQIKNATGDYEPGNTIGKILSNKALVGWTSGGHTAGEVPVMAVGPGAERFTGLMDNTDLFEEISNIANYKMTEHTDFKIAQ